MLVFDDAQVIQTPREVFCICLLRHLANFSVLVRPLYAINHIPIRLVLQVILPFSTEETDDTVNTDDKNYSEDADDTHYTYDIYDTDDIDDTDGLVKADGCYR